MEPPEPSAGAPRPAADAVPTTNPPPFDASPPPAQPGADLTTAMPLATRPSRRPWLIAAGAAALVAVGGGGYAVGLAVGHSGSPKPVATTGPLGSNASRGTNSGSSGGNRPFTGDVTAVNGSTVTLVDTTSGATVTVELTSRTTVRLVNYGSELNIKPGSTITVQGPRIAGNTFRARVVTVDSGPTP